MLLGRVLANINIISTFHNKKTAPKVYYHLNIIHFVLATLQLLLACSKSFFPLQCKLEYGNAFSLSYLKSIVKQAMAQKSESKVVENVFLYQVWFRGLHILN